MEEILPHSPQPRQHLDLSLLASENAENKFLLFKPPGL